MEPGPRPGARQPGGREPWGGLSPISGRAPEGPSGSARKAPAHPGLADRSASVCVVGHLRRAAEGGDPPSECVMRQMHALFPQSQPIILDVDPLVTATKISLEEEGTLCE